jgi:hypothetical protein
MSYSFLGRYGCSQTHWNPLINPIVAHFAPRMRSLRIRGDVSLMNNPAYTQATYMRGKAEYVNNDWSYKSILTSLRTYISAEK